MPANAEFASLSDQLLTVAIICYTLAMLGYAIEYAFGTKSIVAKIANRSPERRLVAVGVGADGSYAGLSDEAAYDRNESVAGDEFMEGERPAPPVSPDRAVLLGKLAILVTVVGALTHAACLVARGLAAGRVPWGNMYEFILAVCLIAVVAWLAVLPRVSVRHLGVFVMLSVVVLLGIAATQLYTQAGPLVPALNSYWLWIHVSAASVASGVLLMGFITTTLYLIRERYDTRQASGDLDERPLRFPVSLGTRLPEADSLERVTFRLHALGFVLWTFAVICGAIWAEAAWGRYWGWDPKEIWSFISWVVYAAYLHARATAGWRGTVSAWIAVVGWITMMINLFAVNLVSSGLHSYAGV